MANIVSNLCFRTGHRLGDPGMDGDYPHSLILDTMDEIYHSMNRDKLCVEKLLSIPTGTFSETVNTFQLPADFIQPFLIVAGGNIADVGYKYIPKISWNETLYQCSYLFTILNGNLVFGGVGSESSLDIYYYSEGLTLVDAADDAVAAGEVNTPEWPASLHRLLVYLTALELKPDYPSAQLDMVRAIDLAAKLERANKDQQNITPIHIDPALQLGGNSMRSNLDPEYYNGQWITRE